MNQPDSIVTDAWVNTEINFNRAFYVYKPPRSRLEIQGRIEAMEKRFVDVLHGVKGQDHEHRQKNPDPQQHSRVFDLYRPGRHGRH